VKNLVFVDFYEIHQDHVDRVIVNSKINYFDPNPEDYITGGFDLLRYNFLGEHTCQGIRLGLRKDRHKKHIS